MSYSQRILELEMAADAAKNADIQNQLAQKRLDEVFAILDDEKTDYMDDGIMRSMLDCIKVEGKHALEFQFKCGINVRETI